MNALLAPEKLMTVEEFLAIPEDGKERWLSRGRLRENTKTPKNRYHSRAMVRVSHLLEVWSEKQPSPKGIVVCGDTGFLLKRNPDSVYGIDVAYVGYNVATELSQDSTLFVGPPILAVEILSPSNTNKEITEKVKDYLSFGVKVVWVVDTDFKTVTVHREGKSVVLFNEKQTIDVEPYMPGFLCPVSEFFE